jgi:hypothetical protein
MKTHHTAVRVNSWRAFVVELWQVAWKGCAGIAAVGLLLIGGCASLKSGVEAPADWSLDPLGCAGIRLREDVSIRASVLDAPAAFPGMSWHVLEYIELAKAVGFTVSQPAVFRNVYRITVLAKGEREPTLLERYQVIDIWSVYPAQDLKICRQWTLHEHPDGRLSTGTLQLLGFDGRNVLLREVRRPLDACQLEALAEVHARIREHFRARVEKAGGEPHPQGLS